MPVLSATQKQLLEDYTALLRKWNKTHNLIGRSTTPDAARRHIEDSVQLVPHLPQNPCQILDVGSGAGLPGLVLAIAAPQHHYTLSERVIKKASFMRVAATTLGLKNITVQSNDCALLPPHHFEVVTARAVAALTDLFPLTEPLLKTENTPLEAPFHTPYWLLLKGRAYEEELAAYPSAQNMTIHVTRSITDASGVILRCHPGRVR
jgi:16S rRNA (guanine527-N7)-methyltransferase